MSDIIIYPSSSNLEAPIRVMSPDGRVFSPEILKRIIEGHEASDVFDETSDEDIVQEEVDNKSSTVFMKELRNYMCRLVVGWGSF